MISGAAGCQNEKGSSPGEHSLEIHPLDCNISCIQVHDCPKANVSQTLGVNALVTLGFLCVSCSCLVWWERETHPLGSRKELKITLLLLMSSVREASSSTSTCSIDGGRDDYCLFDDRTDSSLAVWAPDFMWNNPNLETTSMNHAGYSFKINQSNK